MNAIVLTLLASGLLVGGDAPKPEDVKAQAEKLRGTWKFTKMERDGRDLIGQFGPVDVVFDAEKFASPGIEATFKLDPSQNPRAMDISYSEGPAAGQTVKAIYKLEGDTLTICRGRDHADERPKEFAAPAGSGRFLFQFTRSMPGSP
jgi:uncharacterized protein (TIGR03067 family)